MSLHEDGRTCTARESSSEKSVAYLDVLQHPDFEIRRLRGCHRKRSRGRADGGDLSRLFRHLQPVDAILGGQLIVCCASRGKARMVPIRREAAVRHMQPSSKSSMGHMSHMDTTMSNTSSKDLSGPSPTEWLPRAPSLSR